MLASTKFCSAIFFLATLTFGLSANAAVKFERTNRGWNQRQARSSGRQFGRIGINGIGFNRVSRPFAASADNQGNTDDSNSSGAVPAAAEFDSSVGLLDEDEYPEVNEGIPTVAGEDKSLDDGQLPNKGKVGNSPYEDGVAHVPEPASLIIWPTLALGFYAISRKLSK